MDIQYSMVFVSDMAHAVSFYRDTLGLPLKFESPHWSEFATGGTTLALHPSNAPAPEGAGAANAAGTVRLGFRVPDLDAFHERMLSLGVPCVREPREEFGVRLAQYEGPDGLVFSMGEARS